MTVTHARLSDHVDQLGTQHPPIDLASVDYTVHQPQDLVARFGGVLDYMARAELEVERNVLELATLLPDPPEVDRRFYSQVWLPQESHHGLILDELQVRVGRPPAETNLDEVSTKIRVLGALAHLSPVQDVVRMLYYLTGMTTERSALIAYNKLLDGVLEMGEDAVADTIIVPIRRQEPGHHAYYQMAAHLLWGQLSGWQQWLVRRLRALSFSPVGAGNDEQRADVGEMMLTLGLSGAEEAADFAVQVARVELELLFAEQRGLKVPPYVARSFRECVELAEARAA